MRGKIIIFVALVVVVCGGIFLGRFLMPKNGEPENSANKEYDQADNEKRNAEFLAAQREFNHDKATLTAPPPAPPSEVAHEEPLPVPVSRPEDISTPEPEAKNEPAKLPVRPPPQKSAARPKPDRPAARTVATAATTKAQSGKFKSGTHNFIKQCAIMAKPMANAKTVGSIPKGKKLWVDDHNKSWATVHIKSGAAYVSKSCL